MGRPFIEFIQAQALQWRPAALPGRAGAEVRELSADPETGAASLLVRYPPGWHGDPPPLAVDEELLVLAGDLRVGGTVHTRYGYAHLPAGYRRDGMSSVDGAVALTFFSRAPEPGRESPVDPARLVTAANCFDGPWTAGFHPKFPAGAGRKFLREDPGSGEQTWVLGTMPLRWGRRPEKHPVVEEMYLLAGELVGHVGTMYAGAYFWRPPEEWHGPFGSPTGNLMLFRTIGGPLSTVYTEHEVEFSWRPAHRPVLPPELRGAGATPWAGAPTCF